MAIYLVDNFKIGVKRLLDERTNIKTLQELEDLTTTFIPYGLIVYCEEDDNLYKFTKQEDENGNVIEKWIQLTMSIERLFFEYNTETKKWNYCCEVVEDDDTEKRIIMSLDEYMETEVQEANELAGDTICDKAIVLIDANCIENVELAKNENNFLIYDDNREEVLKNFCNNN
jgi:hypothetical protein